MTRSKILTLTCPLGGLLILIILAMTGLPEFTVRAQTPRATGTSNSSASRSGNVRISNKGKTTWDNQRGMWHMVEDVRVTQDGEDFILYANELFFNEKANQALARGSLRVESRDSTITGSEIRANFNSKLLIITGNVLMKSHAPEDGIQGSSPKEKPTANGSTRSEGKSNDKSRGSMREEARTKASRMTCDKIEYNYESRQAVVTGSIRLVQDKNSGTCERILFDEEQNIAQLTSNDAYGVRFTDGEGRSILTREVIAYIDQDHVETKYPVKIDIPRPRGEATPQPRRTFAPPSSIPDVAFPDAAEPAPAATPDKGSASTAPANSGGATTPAGTG